MASITLDYGSGNDEAQAVRNADTSVAAAEDEAMIEADGTDEAATGAARLYMLPREEGIQAGARRGPSPLSTEEQQALDDATLLGDQETSEAPSPPPVEGASDIRLDALLIEGPPITQMSTSRLFAFVTHFGAQPLGLEWVDDERCNIVFPNEESARLALEYICPATNMSSEPLLPLPNLQTILETPDEEWDIDVISSLVAPRRTHRVPSKLYTAIEKQAAKAQYEENRNGFGGSSALPEDVPEIYREMEEADRLQRLNKPEYAALAKLRSALWVRHAVRDFDVKPSRAAGRSQWYREHGLEAGKEIVPRLLNVGEVGESVELFPNAQHGLPGANGLPARPEGLAAAYSIPAGSRRGRGTADRRAMMDELDSQLDAHIATRDGEDLVHDQKLEGQMMADLIETRVNSGDLMDRIGRGAARASGSSESRWGHDEFERQDHDRPARRRRPRDGVDRHRPTADALDEELEEMRYARDRQRSASPIPRGESDSGRVKIKGRGAMKAPAASSGWGGGHEDAWGDYGTERYGQAKKDRRRRGGESAGTAGNLAARLGSGDLLSRLGDSDRQTSLADRFG